MSVLWNTDFSNPKALKRNENWFGKRGVRKIGGDIESLLFYHIVVLLEPRRPQTATVFIMCERFEPRSHFKRLSLIGSTKTRNPGNGNGIRNQISMIVN